MFFAPYFLYSYAQLLKYFDKIKSQASITGYAIQNSFRNEFLAFVKCDNDRYFPFVMTSSTKYSCDPTWIYDNTKKSFTYTELGFHTTHSLPFIGASLVYKDQPIGDLSDWLMDQKVHGPVSTIPLQVLIGSWRYYFDRTLMFSFKDYRLEVVTDDGDEKTYDLETGQQINKTTSITNLTISEKSGEQTDKKSE
jgi:hypothetical protein